jgi:hypothetical protein
VSRRPRRPVLRGVLPSRRSELAADLLAGVALAALAIPQALGYAKIAGMPVVTGLYTLLLPMAVFAILGSSRHLVVAADSATAAMLAAALAGMAAPASARYVHLAGLAALLTGVLLLLARMARLGFLTNFLSRTILLGFLADVGIQVAIAQLPGMLGLTVTSTRTISRLVHKLAALPRAVSRPCPFGRRRRRRADGRQDHPPDPRRADRDRGLHHREPLGRPRRPRRGHPRARPARAAVAGTTRLRLAAYAAKHEEHSARTPI